MTKAERHVAPFIRILNDSMETYKDQAKRLAHRLKSLNYPKLKHGIALEAIAAVHGAKDYQTLIATNPISDIPQDPLYANNAHRPFSLDDVDDDPKARFETLLMRGPRCLHKYWDFEEGVCLIESLKNDCGYFSSGEIVMAKFFVQLWDRKARIYEPFDCFTDPDSVDSHNQKIIQDWIADPFYP